MMLNNSCWNAYKVLEFTLNKTKSNKKLIDKSLGK